MPNYRLIAWLPGVTEPEAVVIPDPTVDTFSVTGLDPAYTAGGVVHLQYAGFPRPESLIAVAVPTGTVAEPDRTPENLIVEAYPKGIELIDQVAEVAVIDVTVSPPPAPGIYDVAVFGTYPDPA